MPDNPEEEAQDHQILWCFDCGPVPSDDVKPLADDEDIMVHDAPRSLISQRATGKPEGICRAEVCWTRVVRRSRLTALQERVAELERALGEIAERPTCERNPDGIDQAAATMQLIAREALNPQEDPDG